MKKLLCFIKAKPKKQYKIINKLQQEITAEYKCNQVKIIATYLVRERNAILMYSYP